MKANIQNIKDLARQNVRKIVVSDMNVKSDNILKKFLTLEKYKESHSLFIYLSTESEVQTDTIIKQALYDHKEVYVPILIDGMMIAEKIGSDTCYGIGKYGIREPLTVLQDNKNESNRPNKHSSIRHLRSKEENIDIAIIPMLSFDLELNRLGHGKGYYDKWLSGRNIFKIGLAFEEKKFAELPYEDHDVKMDVVITDLKVYWR